MKKSLLRASLITMVSVLAITVSPAVVLAHGEAGLTFTATSTTEGSPPYLIDVDYGESYIEAGSFGRFDFNLFVDGERTKPVAYTDLWVRIEQNDDGGRGKTIFAGPIAKVFFGAQGFGFLFSEGGTYTMSVRYNDASKDQSGATVAEAEFPLTVFRSYDENKFNFGMEFWIGLAGGLLAALIGLLPLLVRKKPT